MRGLFPLLLIGGGALILSRKKRKKKALPEDELPEGVPERDEHYEKLEYRDHIIEVQEQTRKMKKKETTHWVYSFMHEGQEMVELGWRTREIAIRKAKQKVDELLAEWIDKGNYRYTDDCEQLEIGGFDIEAMANTMLETGNPPTPEMEEAVRRFMRENLIPEYDRQIDKWGVRPESMIGFLFDVVGGLMPECKVGLGEGGVPIKSGAGTSLMTSLVAGGMPAYFDAKGYMPMMDVLRQVLAETAKWREDLDSFTLPDGRSIGDLFEEWEKQESEPEPLPPDNGETQLASFERGQSFPAFFGERYILPNL